MQASVLFQLFI